MPTRVRHLCVLLGLGLALGCSGADDGAGGPGNGSSGSAGTTAVTSAGGSSGGQASTGGSSDNAGGPATLAGSGGAGNGGRSNGNGGRSNGNGGNANGGNANGGNANGGSGTGGSSSTGGSAAGSNTGGSNTGGSSTADPYGDARTRCVNRTNELRATKGLGPIPILTKAEPCADGQAKADSISGKAHSAFSACLDQVKWTGAGQNECPNYGSVQDTLTKCLDAMWAEGPGGGHYDNMVGDSTHTACGFYTTPAGKIWMVQDFWTE
jgi:Cysteine-rich secretory protein family